MTRKQYDELQDYCNYKMNHNPYTTSRYHDAYKEALLQVKSKIKEIYNKETKNN